jgi:signal transduction histidine kinase
MHDVLGSDLVKISMLGESAEAECDSPDLLRPRLQKMIRTAQDAVRGMDEIVWAVDPKNDTLDNLANYLSQYAREHFELTTTRLHLDIPPDLPDAPLQAELRHDLFLAVKEALNNTLKHAHAADVWLGVKASAQSLQISVEDNGTGVVAKPNGRQGNGMSNMRNRVVRHGGGLEVGNRNGSGAKIVITLPLI